jgi:hypothetical protein
MTAEVTLFNPTSVESWRRRAIEFLAIAVFALGLHAKLCLYKPQSPTVVLTIIKLSSHDPVAANAVLTSSYAGAKARACDVLASLFCSNSQAEMPPQAHLRQDSAGLLKPMSLALGHYYRFLFFRPPPTLLLD